MGLSCFGAILSEIYYFKPQIIYVSLSKDSHSFWQLEILANARIYSVLDSGFLRQSIPFKIPYLT